MLSKLLKLSLLPKNIRALPCFAVLAMMLVTLFFSACSKQTVDQAEQALRLTNAKHFDIPQPVGFSSTTKQSGLDGDYLLYEGHLPRAKVVDFYTRAMEQHGWEIQDFSNRFEGLLCCNKPHKRCSLSIRAEKSHTAVHVFVKPT